MNSQNDISSILISEQGIHQILPSILVDAIVLDEHFKIIAVSQNVLEYIGFANDELKNQSINFLSGNEDLYTVLKADLAAGYFSNKRARLFTKTKKWISVSLTGFYLGLISDLNGSIILKIKNLDELDQVNQQLLLKKAELEDFIYRTSHDLRGPLATIRGLVNLIRARKNDDELELLIGMMSERTDKLNERLSQLLYLTLAGREFSTPNNIVDFTVIESEIQKIANQNDLPTLVKINFSAPEIKLHGINEILIQALIITLLQHTLSLPMSRLDGSIAITIIVESNSLIVKMESTGFIVDQAIKEALSSEFIYSDIMNYPQLVNYYTAQKIASGLHSQVYLHSSEDNKQQLNVNIPLGNVA
jgi:light-regulated signal transduction histidine kinase (bacteriophytochrome)